MKRLVYTAAVGLLALTLAACGGLAGEPAIVATLPATATTVVREISLPQNPPDLALGAQIYAANCTRCHGQTGRGDGELVQAGQLSDVPDFTNPQTALNDTPVAWFEVVTNGRLEKLMPPWADKLSDAERWAVTLYVFTLPNSGDQIAAGQVVWVDKCAECHGTAGEGTAKGAPLPDLLKVSNADALTTLNQGIPDKMPSFADELSADQQASVIAYARTLRLSGQPVEVAQAATPAPTTDAAGAQATAEPTTAAPATQAVVEPLSTREVVAPVTTQEAGVTSSTGTVSGRVTNGTEGAGVPLDLTVNLHVLSADGQSSAQTFTSPLAADGSFTFTDVPFTTGAQFVVTTSYQNAVFTSEVTTGDPASPQLDLPLNIYEVTSDPASISVDGMLMMVQSDSTPGQLSVVEIVNFTNTSDHAFLQQNNGTSTSVGVRLPSGASYQDFSGGSYLVSSDGTQVSDTNVVFPGDSHVMHIGYTIPYSGTARLNQTLTYPLNGSLEVMVPSGSLSVTGTDISTLGTRQMGTQNFTSFGGNLTRAAGAALDLQVSGAAASATSTTTPAGSVSIIAYVLIGVGLLAIGAAFGFFMRERTGGSRPAPAAPAASAADLNALIKQIADLDVRFQEGKLNEARYRAQRQVLKARLTEQMKSQADPDADDPDGQS